MTRINSAIPVDVLTDEHLLAEHREICHIPHFTKLAIKSNSIKRIPQKFTLNTGHISFFTNKNKFVLNRYKMIYDECIKRGFNVKDYSYKWDCEECSRNSADYSPTQEEKDLLIIRISDRIMSSTKKYWHYKGKRLTKEQAIELLNTCK